MLQTVRKNFEERASYAVRALPDGTGWIRMSLGNGSPAFRTYQRAGFRVIGEVHTFETRK
jgi:hypothetical protein